MNKQTRKMIDEITHQMYSNGMSDGEVRGVFKEFETKFETTRTLQLAAVRAYNESGSAGLEDLIDVEMLSFLQARTGLKGNIRMEKAARPFSPQNSWEVRVVYERETALRAIYAYLKEHPELNLRDATLAVGRERPELFK